MSKYTIRLLDRKEVAEQTMEFVLERPEGFEFKAGQNADYFLIDPPETDAEGNKRTFSFVSSPSEKVVRIATRMRDTAFKRVLKTMPLHSPLTMEGPFGDVTLHHNTAKPAVFFAGGIGITLFHSMALDAAERQLPHRIFLFYSNRRPEDAAYLQELMELEQQNPNYKFIPTMTDMDTSTQAWAGERGRITPSLVQKYISNLSESICYLAGPAGFVAAMRAVLTEAGADQDNIRTEEYPGY